MVRLKNDPTSKMWLLSNANFFARNFAHLFSRVLSTNVLILLNITLRIQNWHNNKLKSSMFFSIAHHHLTSAWKWRWQQQQQQQITTTITCSASLSVVVMWYIVFSLSAVACESSEGSSCVADSADRSSLVTLHGAEGWVDNSAIAERSSWAARLSSGYSSDCSAVSRCRPETDSGRLWPTTAVCSVYHSYTWMNEWIIQSINQSINHSALVAELLQG